MEVTKRETLLQCLNIMERIRNSFSHRGAGLTAINHYEALYEEYDKKCKILREMIQALESEPVRAAMAHWQQLLMDRGPEGAMLLEKELDNLRHFDIEDYTGNNGPLPGRKKDDGKDES